MVLAGEQDVVDRVAGDARKGRENADQQADDGKHERVAVGDPERLQPTAHDEPRTGRDHDPEHDRPAEVADVQRAELRQRQRVERIGAGAEARERPHADRDQRPDPGRQQPGEQDQRQPRAADARRLDQDHRGDQRRGEDERQRGKRPGGRDHRLHLGRRARRTSRIESRPSPDPSAISGASGPSTTPRPIVAIAASMTRGARRRGDAAGRQTAGGNVAAAPGKPRDRQRYQHAGDRQNDERPPARRSAANTRGRGAGACTPPAGSGRSARGSTTSPARRSRRRWRRAPAARRTAGCGSSRPPARRSAAAPGPPAQAPCSTSAVSGTCAS